MADKFKNKYRIPSARNPNWDYRWNAPYFITICTDNRKHYFGEIIDGKMHLSPVGVIAYVLWYEITKHGNNIELGEFVVMPNHIHGIIILNNPAKIFDDAANDDAANDDAANDDAAIDDRIIDDGAINNAAIDDRAIDDRIIDDGAMDQVQTRHALSRSQSPSQSQSPSESQSHSISKSKKSIAQKRFRNPGKNSISSIIGGYKSAVTKYANRLEYDFAWQTRFHDHIIRDDQSFRRISNYIKNNPLKWKEDKFN